MNLKDVIEILMNYDVIRVECLDQIRAKSNEVITGHCDPVAGKILISKEWNHATQREALIHELCHAFYYLRDETSSEKKVTKKEKALIKRLYPKEKSN